MLPTLLLLAIILPVQTEDQRIITSLKYVKNRVQLTIIHGNLARKGHFPYMVSIKRSVAKRGDKWLWRNYCGGSIIKTMKVLTAAHCFEVNGYYFYHHPDALRVVGGSLVTDAIHSGATTNSTEEEQWRNIKTMKLHPDFHFPSNDIALVFLDIPFVYSPNIYFITPARSKTDYQGNCISAGFGTANLHNELTKELLWAEIHPMPRHKCSALWEMNMDNFLCTDSVLTDVGSGDSGGPLTCGNTLDPAERQSRYGLLVGVVSGKNFDKTTLYTRVSAYKDWIDTNGSTKMVSYVGFVFCFVIKFVCLSFGFILFGN